MAGGAVCPPAGVVLGADADIVGVRVQSSEFVDLLAYVLLKHVASLVV